MRTGNAERLDFKDGEWDCWFNPLCGWGAILSRKGVQAIIISGIKSREALVEKLSTIKLTHMRKIV